MDRESLKVPKDQNLLPKLPKEDFIEIFFVRHKELLKFLCNALSGDSKGQS
jgi:hypothetical protein